MVRNPAFLAAICVLALATMPTVGTGQSALRQFVSSDQPGTLEGRLTDWHSAPLDEASIKVRNLLTGQISVTRTGKNGTYRLAGLTPGDYRLEADVPSLGHGQVEGILISAGHATHVQAALVLELPRVAELPATPTHELDPITPAVATTMTGEELSGVPLRERNWQSIAGITPSAHPAAASAEESTGALDSGSAEESMSLSGSTHTSRTVDGVASTSGFSSVGAQDRGQQLGESAISEVEPRSGMAPSATSHAIGGAMSMTTAHGANGLHGQAFFHTRQNLWDAHNPYTQLFPETAPVTGTTIAGFTGQSYTPPNSSETFGVGVGSQIRRDKLYWFGALDGLFKNDPGVAMVRQPENFFLQPTNDALAVLGARLGIHATDLFEEEVGAYSAGLQQLTGLLGEEQRTTNQIQGFARVDWQAGDRDHLSLTGGAARFRSPGGALGNSSETVGSHSFGNRQSDSAWGLLRWERFITANLLNEADVRLEQQVLGDTPQSPSAFESTLETASGSSLPEIIGDSKYGFILGNPARLGGTKYPDERGFVAQDSVSWVHGQHLVKAGASFVHLADAVNSIRNESGTYSYADVLNLISDSASFAKYGFRDINNPLAQPHNCDATGRVHSSGGEILGLGTLPCYAWYTQRIGPENWHVSTNDLAGFVTEQWQPAHQLTISAGLRAEAEQLPPAIAMVKNSDLPATEALPGLGISWGPRVGLAWSPSKGTVMRVGAGMYFGRVDNSVALAAVTQTGSLNGDLNFYFKPTDVGAPPFPYVFPVEPQQAVAPGAVFFAPHFHVQEVDQGVFSVEQELPGHWQIAASAMVSLGRRLPISVDTNLQPSADSVLDTVTYAVVDALGAGPIKGPTVTVPFYVSLPGTANSSRINGSYQQLDAIESRANSTYEAAMLRVTRYGGHGLSVRAHYLFAHAADWNPNEGGNVAVNNVLDPADFGLEYGRSNLDIRQSGGVQLLWETPWKRQDWEGWLVNHWSIGAVGQFRSGLPYTMRTSGYSSGFYTSSSHLIESVGPGMNGSGGDNRVYGVGRNTYSYPVTWTGDTRLGKRFDFAHHRELELLAESFNLFNHQNVTRVETTGYLLSRGSTSGELPTLNFMTGLKTNTVEFGKPLNVNGTNYYRPREFQLGLRARF